VTTSGGFNSVGTQRLENTAIHEHELNVNDRLWKPGALIAEVQRAIESAHRQDGCTASPGRRRVLMISCAFPPTGGPGVQRSAKFAKYLPGCDWQPIVWAADRVPGLPHDPSLQTDLPPDLAVHRWPVRDPSARLRACRAKGGLSGRAAWWAERLWTGWLRCMPPDPMVWWALRSFRACRRLIDAHDVEVIYSTYSPASNHLLAWGLKRATEVPWVADFRDLWTDDYGYPHARGLRRRIDRTLEVAFVRSADAVIAVSDSQRDVLRRHQPDQPEKFVTISNGFDPADFADLDRVAIRGALHGPEEQFVLTFTGWFLSDRVSPGLVEGITRMGAWARQQSERFVLRIVGQVSADMIRRFQEAGVAVETPGYLPHREAVRHQLAADALLLLIPEGPNGQTLLTGKIFEYLASRTPILLVAPSPDCEAVRLLRSCQTSMVTTHEGGAVFEALKTLWLQWKYGGLPPACADEDLPQFSRAHQAQQLADVLARVSVLCPARP